MNRLFAWDKADTFCPIEASSPPPFTAYSDHLLAAANQRSDSFVFPTAQLTDGGDLQNLCARVTGVYGSAILESSQKLAQNLILDELNKLASQGNLTPPTDNSANATSGGLSSVVAEEGHHQQREITTTPSQQQNQQQKQLSTFLSALANTTPVSPINNVVQPSLAAGPSSEMFIRAGEALVKKTTADLLNEATMSSRISDETPMKLLLGPSNSARGLNPTLNIQQSLNTTSQLIGMLTGQQQALPPANHLLSSSASAASIQQNISQQQQQQHQELTSRNSLSGLLEMNKSALETIAQSNLLQAVTTVQAVQQGMMAADSIMAAASGIVGNTEQVIGGGSNSSLIGDQQTNTFNNMISSSIQQSPIQQLLNQKTILDEQIRQHINQMSSGAGQFAASNSHQQIQQQQVNQHSAAAQLPSLAISELINIPSLFNTINTQQQQQQQLTLQESKPIPLWNNRIDLISFRQKPPQEWTSDDVIAWIMDVARRHNIQHEHLNLHRFVKLTGSLLVLMNEQSFADHDPNFGPLLYNEFNKACANDSMANLARTTANLQALNENQQLLATLQFQQKQAHLQQQLRVSQQPAQSGLLLSAAASGVLSQNASLISRPSPMAQNTQQLQQQLQQMAQQQQQKQQSSLKLFQPLLQQAINIHQAGPSSMQIPMAPSGSGMAAAGKTKKELKVRKNKDGRPRKRSQHTKGNKLWEFIRDALKDPKYCPSVVRWEDQTEGVFRIVESERLAYLWGQKKNNVKMTYEKLSRAMRTYYEKEILVPVPKCGLYPKKLVYKFGPSAHGWRMKQMSMPFPAPDASKINLNIIATTAC